MIMNMLLNAPIATDLKTTEALDVAIERSKDISSAVRKKSVQLLSKLYTFSEHQTSRVKILNAIMMATVDVERSVSAAAVKAARDFLFGDDFCRTAVIERAKLLLSTTESLFIDGHVEVMKRLFVQCKESLVSTSSENYLSRDLILSLLHQYIATDTPGNADGNFFNILSYIICAIIKIYPQAITIADIDLMSSSVDFCDEKKAFCILTILETVSWKKFLQHKNIVEELKRLLSNMIRKPLSYRALEKSVNCLCLIDASKSIKVSNTALAKLSRLVHSDEISIHAHGIVILSIFPKDELMANTFVNEGSNIHLLKVVKEMLHVVRWSIQNESTFASQRDINIIGKSAIRCILLYARSDLLTSQSILHLFNTLINTSSNELKVELLYVFKKLLLKEYENDNEELQETEHFKKWSARTEERSKHNSISATVQAHFRNITDLVFVNDIYIQTAVVSVMTEIIIIDHNDNFACQRQHHLRRCVYLANSATMIEYISVDEIKTVLAIIEQRICELETEITFGTTIVFDDEESLKIFNIIMMGLLLKIIRSYLQNNPLVEKSNNSVKEHLLYDHKHTTTSPQDLIQAVLADVEDACNGKWCQEMIDRAMCLHRSNAIGDRRQPHQNNPVTSPSGLQRRQVLERRCKKQRM
ncbi:hypothetical protein INT44_004442 [Umbelopsis vinacea]|uniref:Uncharacterized protein n=1 Tax=Umbelopsis vinacea TaxID=44442 RepID=A0A8H7QCF6_9FUNG|nr:hypothetical protein INT44_004442 [Umbelopsis vinacea]